LRQLKTYYLLLITRYRCIQHSALSVQPLPIVCCPLPIVFPTSQLLVQQIHHSLTDNLLSVVQPYFHGIYVYTHGLQLAFVFAIPTGLPVAAFKDQFTPLVEYSHVGRSDDGAIGPEGFVPAVVIRTK